MWRAFLIGALVACSRPSSPPKPTNPPDVESHVAADAALAKPPSGVADHVAVDAAIAIAKPPPDVETVGATPLRPVRKLPDDWRVESQLEHPRAPWDAVEYGWSDHEVWLAATIGRQLWLGKLTGGIDGAPPESFELRDVVPGGPPEIVLELDENTDGGKAVRLVVCGIGASRKPSCSAMVDVESGDLRDPLSFDLVVPPSGGIELVPVAGVTKPRRRLAFAFQ